MWAAGFAGGLVVAVGVEGSDRGAVLRWWLDDPNVEVADEQNDVGSGVGSADADVVQAAVDPQSDRA